MRDQVPWLQAVKALAGEPAVAQRYLAKPLLIGGYKHDLRVYALVLSCDPLRVFVYRDGLARFCTIPYAAPAAGNLGTACMHLTNYAINRRNAAFDEGDASPDGRGGSKWRLGALLERLDAMGAAPVATLCTGAHGTARGPHALRPPSI